MFHCKGIQHFVYLFTSWWIFGLFPLLAIMNNATMNIYQTLCRHMFSVHSEELPDSSSRWLAASFCISISSGWGQFLYILTSACYFLFFFFIIAILVGIKWRWKSLSRVRLFATPWTLQSMAFSRPEYWSGYLIQGIFPTQGSNPGLRHYRWILYQLTHKRSPRILEWVAYPFSSGSSRPRNWTGVSCIAGGFFTNWAIREAQQI